MTKKIDKEEIYHLYNIEQKAQKAFDNTFYVEALVLLHNEIEFHLKTLVRLDILGSGQVVEKKWKYIEELSYKNVAKLAFIFDFIEPELFEMLQVFNRARNNIVHELLRINKKKKTQIKLKTIQEAFNIGKNNLNNITDIFIAKLELTNLEIKKIHKEVNAEIDAKKREDKGKSGRVK